MKKETLSGFVPGIEKLDSSKSQRSKGDPVMPDQDVQCRNSSSNSTTRSVSKKITAGEPITILDKLVIFQLFSRKWRRYLTPNEIVVMSYVVDRCISWGNASFRASHGNVLAGNKDYSGVGMAERTYKRTLSTLNKKGILRTKSRRNYTEFNLNLDWTTENSPELQDSNALASNQKCLPVTSKSASLDTLGMPQWHTEYSSSDYSKIKRETAVPPAGSSEVFEEDFSGEEKSEACTPVQGAQNFSADFEETAKHSVCMVTTAGQTSLAKTEHTAIDLENIWKAALAETYPDVASGHRKWTPKYMKIARDRAAAWSNSTVTYGELMDWSVRNWSRIITSEFAWMTKQPAPQVPTLSFFITGVFFERFANCFLEKKLKTFRTASTANAVDRKMAGGAMTQEQAILSVAKDEAQLAERAATDRKLDQAKQLNRDSGDKLKKAEQMDALAEKLAKGEVEGLTLLPKRAEGQVWGYGLSAKKPEPAPRPVVTLDQSNSVNDEWEAGLARTAEARNAATVPLKVKNPDVGR